jgi:serine/threonine-protein kinase
VATLAALLVAALVAGTSLSTAFAIRAKHEADQLAAANERERARFALAMDAVKLFHGEVSEDFLLKEQPFEALRTKLLRGAARFYTKLEGLLAGQTDRPSRAALARAYDELAELTDQIGSKPEALAVHRKALAVRRELANDPKADTQAQADVARSLIAIGWLQEQTGDMAGALASYREALGLTTTGPDERLQVVLGLTYQRIGRLLEYTGRPTEAAPCFEQAVAIQRKLAETHPDVNAYQVELSNTYQRISHLMVLMGKPAEAARADEWALAIRRRLADADPSNVQFKTDLAQSDEHFGYNLQLIGKAAEAMSAYRRAQALRQELADANPNITELQYLLARSHDHIGWGYRQSGKQAEALAALERAMTIYRKLVDTNRSTIIMKSRMAFCLASAGGIHLEAGRPAEASASLRQAAAILERLPTLEPVDRYNLACVHGKLAGLATMPGSGMTAAEEQAEAERAMHWLRQAVAAGYRNVALMRRDADIDPLRSRPDFQLLMMDLEFPDDPFARGD